MAAIYERDVIVFSHALAGEKVSLDELAQVLSKMLENLASSLGDEGRARRIFLESMPVGKRRAFTALLPRPTKRKGAPKRIEDAMLLTIWECWQRSNPIGTKEDFGKWWSKSELRVSMKKDGRKVARLIEPKSVVRRLNRTLQKQRGQ
jgi:hypothetical protein